MKSINYSNSQSGVALMLSVLVLAAITAIAFSLATIVFIELRSSRDVLRSEPALYATLGVTEEALFQYKRFVPSDMMDVTTCFPSKSGEVCDINGVSMASPAPELLTEEETPHLETIYASKTNEIPLYFLQDSTCDDACSWNMQYGEIEFELVPQGVSLDQDLTVTVKCIDQGGLACPEQEFTVNIDEGSGRQSWTPPVIADRHYWLELNNPTTSNMLLSIWSRDHQGNDKGLPIILERVLKIVADYAGLTRTYRVEIPIGNSN